MIEYGSQIGRKFEKDGSVRRYPGNTVIADVRPGCAAYDAMTHLRTIAREAGLEDTMILLPEDSYHMTVIRGLNDQVRTDAYWPAALAKDATMEQADDYVQRAFESAGMPGKIRMRFCGVWGFSCRDMKATPTTSRWRIRALCRRAKKKRRWSARWKR